VRRGISPYAVVTVPVKANYDPTAAYDEQQGQDNPWPAEEESYRPALLIAIQPAGNVLPDSAGWRFAVVRQSVPENLINISLLFHD
jgi:hypothetical protein